LFSLITTNFKQATTKKTPQMNIQLILPIVFAVASSASADPIQVTVQCAGAPAREAARATSRTAATKRSTEGTIGPIQATIQSGQSVTLETVREFCYATSLDFPKTEGVVVTPTKWSTKNTGITVTLTATKDGDQIMFQGTCTVRRPASNALALSATPQNKPSVNSTAFISRECDFAGRTPVGTPAKVNLGEQGVDSGLLTLTFASAK
jgi:hypothetical protein